MIAIALGIVALVAALLAYLVAWPVPISRPATFALIRPAFRLGLAAFSASIVLTSEANDGVEVASGSWPLPVQ